MDIIQKNKFLTLVIAILIILNVFSIGLFWFTKLDKPFIPPNPVPPPPMNHNHPVIDSKRILIEELRFSPPQAESLEKLQIEHFQEMDKYLNELRKLKDEMMTNLTKINNNNAEQIAQNIGEITSKIELLRFEHFGKIRDLCDDVQKTRFDVIIKDISKKIYPPGNIPAPVRIPSPPIP